MLAEMTGLFKPEIGALIRPSESVEGVAESAACPVQHLPQARTRMPSRP
jgi:hypothetical protein